MAVNDGDVVKVVQNIELPDLVIAQNVYHWQLNDPTPDNPSNAQIVSALDTRLDDMYSQIDDAIINTAQVSDFRVERVEWNVDLWETVENVGIGDLNLTGLLAGAGLPHGCAATVTAYTSRPQTRGRKFFPAFYEAGAADSTWTGTVLGWMTQYALSWLTDQVVVGSAELVPVVVGQSGPSAGLIYPLIATAINAIVGYQRRRKPGVGI